MRHKRRKDSCKRLLGRSQSESLWKGLNEVAIMHQLVTNAIPSAREVDPRVPAELDAICRRALAPNVEDRYPTAADMANDIERYLYGIGDRTTPRDIARMLGDAFDADRKELREIIDQQLRALREGTRQVSMPKLPGASTPIGESGSGKVSASMLARPAAAQLDQNAAPSYTTGGTASAASAGAKSRPPQGLMAAGMMIAGALVLLGVVVFVVLQKSPKPAAPVPVVEQSTTTSVSKPDSIEVTVTANPASAQLFLDDAPLGTSPYHAVFPRDGLTHRIRAEQVLYAPRTEIVVFDKPSATIDLTLMKGVTPGMGPFGMPNKLPPTAPPHPTAPPAASTNASPTAPPTHGGKPPRQIDTSFGP